MSASNPLLRYRWKNDKREGDFTLSPPFTTLLAVLLLAALALGGKLDAVALMEFVRHLLLK